MGGCIHNQCTINIQCTYPYFMSDVHCTCVVMYMYYCWVVNDVLCAVVLYWAVGLSVTSNSTP